MTARLPINHGFIACPMWGKQDSETCPFCSEYAGLNEEKTEVLCDCENKGC